MIVRFNNRALQDHVERRSTPIGVEGDPPSYLTHNGARTSAGASSAEIQRSEMEAKRSSGISETEAIVSAARKGMPMVSESESLARLSTEMILEEEQAEPGPELDPEGLNKAKEKAQEGKEKEAKGGDAGHG